MVDNTTPLTRERTEQLSLADLGKKIKSEHEALANSLRSMVPRAIEIGEDLNNAKRIVGHGGFLKWVKLNCAMSNKTAERYMALATGKDKLNAKLRELSTKGDDKFETISNLSLVQAERLIAEPQSGGGDGDNLSDAYDNAEKALVKKLKALPSDVAEAAANETIGRLQSTIATMKRVAQAAYVWCAASGASFPRRGSPSSSRPQNNYLAHLGPLARLLIP
jgi:hypothetical protein